MVSCRLLRTPHTLTKSMRIDDTKTLTKSMRIDDTKPSSAPLSYFVMKPVCIMKSMTRHLLEISARDPDALFVPRLNFASRLAEKVRHGWRDSPSGRPSVEEPRTDPQEGRAFPEVTHGHYKPLRALLTPAGPYCSATNSLSSVVPPPPSYLPHSCRTQATSQQRASRRR